MVFRAGVALQSTPLPHHFPEVRETIRAGGNKYVEKVEIRRNAGRMGSNGIYGDLYKVWVC